MAIWMNAICFVLWSNLLKSCISIVPTKAVPKSDPHFRDKEMLPGPGVFHFPWEISSVQEGAAVRTYGRLLSYQPEVSEAVLSSQHLSVQYDITVYTAFVEPFLPSLHSHYIVLGDVERTEGDGVMVRARVLNCVDGVNLARLQQAIMEQRRYLQERDGEAPVQPPAQ